MSKRLNVERRHFLKSSAMTVAAFHAGCFGATASGASRELASLGRATEWINSAPLGSEALSGKVVVVGFWTYTCINWLRTLPYLRAWSQRYAPGVAVVGVHTPEFSFEHDLTNVRRAVSQMAIDYPVAVDNDADIWRA